MATELAPANSADMAESVLAEPSDGLDNPESLNFWEPGDTEPADPEHLAQGTDSNSETDETHFQGQEAEEPEQPEAKTETEPAKDASKDAEPDDSIVVAIPGGEKIELKELKNGYMRDRDYRHKTTDLANQRRNLEVLSARVSQSANAISEALMAQVPAAPNQNLALTDPVGYVQQKAQHDAAMEFVNSIVEKATSAKDVVNTLTQEQRSDLIRSEVAKLVEAFPQTATSEGKKQFLDAALSGAREIGFTDEELGAVTDHRMFKALHYVKLGLEAEAAKKKAAAKVVDVPPVATQRRQPPNASSQARNQDRMKQLGRTGSMQDAMAVDFD